MTFTGVFCLLLCLVLFVFRKGVLNRLGITICNTMQKGLSSCDGRISVVEKESQDVADENVFYINNISLYNGFILDVKSIGQNFDLNAPKNIKYSTPSPYQDLKCGNGLA